MGRPKKYSTEEERLEARRLYAKLYNKKHRENHPDKYKKYSNVYYQKHKQEYVNRSVKWQKENPDKYKKQVRAANCKCYKKIIILKKIEKLGEAVWLINATEEELSILLEYKMKQKKS